MSRPTGRHCPRCLRNLVDVLCPRCGVLTVEGRVAERRRARRPEDVYEPAHYTLHAIRIRDDGLDVELAR